MVQENVNVQQVKQNTDMDSHEEKLHDVIIKSKIEDTKNVMKAKAREIEASKLERMQVSQVFHVDSSVQKTFVISNSGDSSGLSG